jgi:hypothetical protein
VSLGQHHAITTCQAYSANDSTALSTVADHVSRTGTDLAAGDAANPHFASAIGDPSITARAEGVSEALAKIGISIPAAQGP